ncbi:hypothetical protein HKCCE3408_16450 [Rhodobacterales bacterium HKCCE3408]|nr:hypothetical protein [Rhodobacterales bacterium HKCCE3408]
MTDTPDDTAKRRKPTLIDEDIQTRNWPSRRRILTGIGLGTAGLGLAGCVPTTGGGITDSDNGPITDPGGAGRGGLRAAPTGLTDSDNGPIVDPGGYGRGGGRIYRSGITDRDGGYYADPAGNGRGTGCTDSDFTPPADPVGRGRRC